MAKKIQEKVKEEILQESEKVVINGKEYEVAPPSIATLIMASAEIANFPTFELNKEDMINSLLHNAKDCGNIGRIIAILILGAKAIKQAKNSKSNILSRLFGKGQKSDILSELSEELENASPQELQSVMAQLILRLQLGDFFALTTFLQGVNITKPTAKVEN